MDDAGTCRRFCFSDTDHLNTPRAIYDDQQQLRWKWEQAEPFGVNVRASRGALVKSTP